ncbi:Uncharacterised protein [Mycobacteroides abscessus subsp. abscessus]|nr:Uncharacterised protein [Mycobacteroides abscessus subsp. abscessus]
MVLTGVRLAVRRLRARTAVEFCPPLAHGLQNRVPLGSEVEVSTRKGRRSIATPCHVGPKIHIRRIDRFIIAPQRENRCIHWRFRLGPVLLDEVKIGPQTRNDQITQCRYVECAGFTRGGAHLARGRTSVRDERFVVHVP